MFKWYFSFDFIENSFLFWFTVSLIIAIIIATIILVRKALKEKDANK
jgi:hypothetical protein